MSRMIDVDTEPSEKDIIRFIGHKSAVLAWNNLEGYLSSHYSLHAKELQFGGQKYGWSLRYRRGGKTLCTLHPEEGGFTVLIVFGKKEVEQFNIHQNEFSRELVTLFQETKQLHDGKWLWIRIRNSDLLDDIKQMLSFKRSPEE
jgi:hypothetical protein